MYIVIARSNETIKEGYAMAGARAIPFDTPVAMSDREVESVKRQKEAIQLDKQINVRELMEKHQISQAKANEMAKLIAENPEQGGKKIEFVPKYIVTPA